MADMAIQALAKKYQAEAELAQAKKRESVSRASHHRAETRSVKGAAGQRAGLIPRVHWLTLGCVGFVALVILADAAYFAICQLSRPVEHPLEEAVRIRLASSAGVVGLFAIILNSLFPAGRERPEQSQE